MRPNWPQIDFNYVPLGIIRGKIIKFLIVDFMCDPYLNCGLMTVCGDAQTVITPILTADSIWTSENSCTVAPDSTATRRTLHFDLGYPFWIHHERFLSASKRLGPKVPQPLQASKPCVAS